MTYCLTSGKKISKRSMFAIFFALILVISTFPVSAVTYDLEYDSNGNLIKDRQNYYEYDSFNNLVKIRVGNSTGKILSEFSYDDSGQRIKKVVYGSDGKADITTYYVSKDFVRTVDRNGTIKDEVYYYDSFGLVAKENSTSKQFYLNDHLGSVDVVLDSKGNVIADYEYLPFGLELNNNTERYGFTGQERDPEAGLQYYNARYYSPELMRFTQPDTIISDIYNSQSFNRYSYALNNPVKYTDPSGHLVDILADTVFIAWDAWEIIKDPSNKMNWGYLGLDIAGAALPFVTGLSAGFKAAEKASNVFGIGGKSGKYVDNFIGESIRNTGKYSDKFSDSNKILKNVPDVLKSGSGETVKFVDIKEFKASQPNINPEKLRSSYTSIKNSGFDINSPVRFVNSEGNKILVDGHHRLTAANRLGYTKVPAVEITNTAGGIFGRYVDESGKLLGYRGYDQLIQDSMDFDEYFRRLYLQ